MWPSLTPTQRWQKAERHWSFLRPRSSPRPACRRNTDGSASGRTGIRCVLLAVTLPVMWPDQSVLYGKWSSRLCNDSHDRSMKLVTLTNTWAWEGVSESSEHGHGAPTPSASCNCGFASRRGGAPQVDGGDTFTEPSVIMTGRPERQENVVVRVHDACFTSGACDLERVLGGNGRGLRVSLLCKTPTKHHALASTASC